MTQAAINNAKVLYQLHIEREVVEKADKLIFLTPELLEVLENPTIAEAKKHEIIERVCALAQMPQMMVSFLKMMSHLGECDIMRQIFDAYYAYWDEQNHIIRAQIIFAGEPDAATREEAEQLLQKKYPDYKIVMTESVDETLLGGYIVRMKNEEYDRSYEGRLRQLERKLTGR